MAGIGFVLRKLYHQDNLSGFARACLHSAFATAGPWLFTVLALGTIAVLGKNLLGTERLFSFRVILIYNFSFSLVLSGPIFIIVTRYLSDGIYRRDISMAPGTLLGSLVLLWGIEFLAAGIFYLFCVHLEPLLAASAIVNFLLLSAIWLIGIFISTMRNYRLITAAFLIGMATAVGACMLLGFLYGVVGMINGFSAGLAVIAGILLGNVVKEYPYPITQPFAFLSYFRKFPDLALSGFIYATATWADKWIMWCAPESVKMSNGLIAYPHYDSTMFLAYLSTVPAMALFLFSTETHFFEIYMRFYRHIERKASFAKIEKDHREIVRSIFNSAESFFLLQGSIAVVCALMAPEIVRFLHGDFLQIGMLRYGVFGALFQVLTLFLLVLLSYFDNRKASLLIQSVFLVTNAAFTFASIKAGFPYYGFGYFLSTFVTFLIAVLLMRRYVARLPYHTFITTNASVT